MGRRSLVLQDCGFLLWIACQDQWSQPLDSSTIRFLEMKWKEEEEVKEKEVAKRKDIQQASDAMDRGSVATGADRQEEEEEEEKETATSSDFLGLRGSSGGDSHLRVRVCRLLVRLLWLGHEFGGEWLASIAQRQFRIGLSCSGGFFGVMEATFV